MRRGQEGRSEEGEEEGSEEGSEEGEEGGSEEGEEGGKKELTSKCIINSQCSPPLVIGLSPTEGL